MSQQTAMLKRYGIAEVGMMYGIMADTPENALSQLEPSGGGPVPWPETESTDISRGWPKGLFTVYEIVNPQLFESASMENEGDSGTDMRQFGDTYVEGRDYVLVGHYYWEYLDGAGFAGRMTEWDD